MDGITVQFVSGGYPPYAPGDIATFPEDRARKVLALRSSAPNSGSKAVAVIYEASRAAAVASAAPRKIADQPLRRVTFIEACGPYFPGEQASFPESQARVYVDGGSYRGSSPRRPVAVWTPGDPAEAESRRGPGRPRKEGVVLSAEKEG